MVRKLFSLLLALVVVVGIASAGFALVKGLEENKQSIVKVSENVVIPPGANVKSAVAVNGTVTVYGQVEEDVVAVGGSVFLKDSSLVNGDVVSIGGQVIKDPGAETKGEVTEVAFAGIYPTLLFFTKGGMLQGMLFFGLISFIGFLILAIILVALFTPQLGKVSGNIETKAWRSFWIGLLALLLFVPITLLLVVSLAGIVLVPVWAVIFGAACLFGYIAAAHFLGKKTLAAFKVAGKSMMFETVTGIILLAIVGLVPVGGFIVKLIAGLCGLGAVTETRFGLK